MLCLYRSGLCRCVSPVKKTFSSDIFCRFFINFHRLDLHLCSILVTYPNIQSLSLLPGVDRLKHCYLGREVEDSFIRPNEN